MTTYEARIFSQESYDRHDQQVKDIVVAFLKRMNHEPHAKEDYNHDIISTYQGYEYYWEVEAKTGYRFTSRSTFPFPSVSFAGRKKRLHEKKPFYYFIVNVEDMCGIYCHSSIIYNEQYAQEIMINRERKGLDKLYRVPKDKCDFISLKDGVQKNN